MRGRAARTPGAREAFLAALEESGNVTASATAAGLKRSTVYQWRSEDPEFAEAWDAALELGLDALEDEAIRRGKDGVESYVVSHGRIVLGPDGKPLIERKYSDGLLLAILRARRREVWGDKQDVNLNGTGDLAEAIADARRRAKGE